MEDARLIVKFHITVYPLYFSMTLLLGLDPASIKNRLTDFTAPYPLLYAGEDGEKQP